MIRSLPRFSFTVRLWLKGIYTWLGLRWRRVWRPASSRPQRRVPLRVERMESIEAANNLLPVFTTVAGAAIVANMTNDAGGFAVDMNLEAGDATPTGDTTKPADESNEAATAVSDQVFTAIGNDPNGPFALTLAPVNLDGVAPQQPGDGLTGDPTDAPTGGNGAFARPPSGASAQGQGAQGSSGLANTPHMPTVHAPDPSGTGANSSSQGQQGASAASFVPSASGQATGSGQPTSGAATTSTGSSPPATTSTSPATTASQSPSGGGSS